MQNLWNTMVRIPRELGDECVGVRDARESTKLADPFPAYVSG